jgi:hypothetical protein
MNPSFSQADLWPWGGPMACGGMNRNFEDFLFGFIICSMFDQEKKVFSRR